MVWFLPHLRSHYLKLSLGICWTPDQYRTGLRDGLSHAFAELLVERHMGRLDGRALLTAPQKSF